MPKKKYELASSAPPQLEVITHPVLSSLSNKSTLSTTSRRIPHDGVSSRSHQVVQARQLDDEGVVVLSVEGSFVKVFSKEGSSQGETCLFLSRAGKEVSGGVKSQIDEK